MNYEQTLCRRYTLKPTCFCFCLACEKNKALIKKGKRQKTIEVRLSFGSEASLKYLHSPADGGVVLQLPVTMSPKLEELPPVFLQQQNTHVSNLYCGRKSHEKLDIHVFKCNK